MTELSLNDLKFIHLGIAKNGNFNEKDIAKSELSKLGVGRILDQLASLKERNLVWMNKDGSFSITETAKIILWEPNTPIEIKILKILEISPQELHSIASFLLISEEIIQNVIERLQKDHLVLMVTIKKDLGIVRSYEILPEGSEYLEKAKSVGPQSLFESTSERENIRIIQNTIEEIKKLDRISTESKNKIISDLEKVKKSLEK